MKKLATLLILMSCYTFVTAQENRPGNPIGGTIIKQGKNPGGSTVLSIGGGLNNPTRTTKDKANLGNGYAFNANVYVPLFAQEGTGVVGKTDHFFTIGFNVGGEYFGGNKSYDPANFSAYNIIGQTGTPSIMANDEKLKQTGFKAEGGAQANFSFGKLTISPILNAGYLNLQQKAFTISQTSAVNGKTYDYNLYDQSETKTSGFAIAPKLRIAYFLGKLGLYVEGNYTSGPTIKNEVTMFKPQGNPNDQGLYNLDQMATATNQSIIKSTKFNSVGVNVGIGISLGKGHSEKGMKRTMASPPTQGRLRGKVSTPGDGGMLNTEAASNRQRTYTGGRKNETAATEAGDPERTYTGGRKNETSNLAEGSPIGGVTVKGGKNPGGNLINLVTNNKGEFEFTAHEAGNYKFSVANPEPQGKSINEKGIKRTANTTVTKSVNPIGVVIIKGSKNPDNSIITIISNEKGEFELNNLEAGNYKFTIIEPAGSQGKSISEKGVSSTKPRKN